MKQNKKYKALAGSGKTIKLKQQISQIAPTTSSNIILLSFNKKLEQENKYLEKTYKNLSVRTFHSLAWGAVTNKFGKFKATSVPNYNMLQKSIIIINKQQLDKVFKLFCDSRYTLEEFKLIATEDFKKAFGFHEDIIDELEQLIIEIEKTKAYTHGYYLKKFQLMKPKLNYNYIFIDEFQDFTDCMIEIIKLQEQNGSKIIMAGDMYQKIYRWKGASGDFSSIHFQEELMPKTYRCPQEVVDVANHYVTFLSNGKEKLETHNKNVGKVSYCDIDFEKNIFDINTDWVTTRQDFCAIARTNASLINVANELCTIYNIKNNLSLDMEDIENHYLFFHKKKGSNTFLNSFKGTVTMLKNYYTSVMQFDKASLVNSVQKIRNFRDFKNAVENHSEDKPTLTISTVFSAKGLEWDRILILPDYKHHLQHFEDEELKVIEEDDYRYLYVAITRTKKHLSIPKIYDTSFTHEDISDFIYLDDKEGEDVIQAEMRHYNMIRQAKLKLKLDLDIDGDN